MAAPVAWLVPSPFDGSRASLAEHVRAIAAMMRGEARLWLGPFAPPASLPAGLEETALVVPTSGSTGSAKAVALALGALRASQDATALALAAPGAPPAHGLWLPLLPPTHIAGIQVIARACRAAEAIGHPEPLLPAELPVLAEHFDAGAFALAAAPALQRARDLDVPALTSLVPTQLGRILGDGSPTGRRAVDLLRGFAAVLVGGAATPPPLLERARAAGVAVRTTYGASETAGGCVYDGVPLPGVRLGIDGPVGIGGPDPVAPPATGRLVLASPTLALGCLTADGTADTSAFADAAGGGRALITSDLARVETGADGGPRVEILGRADDVVITGGRKVLPQDVERALETSPSLAGAISASAVVGVPDEEWGARLVALVVPAAGTDGGDLPARVPKALRASDLPPHAVPKRTLVVGALPLRGIGKIDRSAARDLAIARGA